MPADVQSVHDDGAEVANLHLESVAVGVLGAVLCFAAALFGFVGDSWDHQLLRWTSLLVVPLLGWAVFSGMRGRRLSFDHGRRVLCIRSTSGALVSEHAYREVALEWLPARQKLVVDPKGPLNSLHLSIDVADLDAVAQLVAQFTAAQSDDVAEHEQQLLLAEKAQGLGPVPELGAGANAGTPVAVPLTLTTRDRE